MRDSVKRGMASAIVLVLLAVLGVGCGGGGGGGVRTIVVGEINDLTGPASPALVPMHYAFQDLVSYYNEEGLIPGAKLKLVTYDDHLDTARDIPGYDWCRARGAQVVFAVPATAAETLKSFGERDKVPILTFSATEPLVEPPGWAFIFSDTRAGEARTMLKWVSENHWDYTAEGRVPKVGFLMNTDASGVALQKAFEEYCQAHPDKFENGGSRLVPAGALSVVGEARAMRDCDYLLSDAWYPAFFARDSQTHGGFHGTLLGLPSTDAFQGMIVDLVGWKELDGMLTLQPSRLWDEPYPVVQQAIDVLHQYHPGDADKIIRTGNTYLGVFQQTLAVFQILEKAIKEVGAENFNGQTFYNTAVHFEVQFEGLPKWYFTETERWMIRDVAIYKWSAEEEAVVRVSDWLPLVTE